MLPNDLAQLSTPIPRADPRSPEQQFHDSLGISLPRWRYLNASIRADLDRDTKGVKWWTELPESQRRLISHQLIESLATVPGLLANARIHLLEVADAVDVLNASTHCIVVGKSEIAGAGVLRVA